MTDSRPYAKLEWMGRLVRVTFAPNWPVPYGNYTFDGFGPDGIWVTHADGHQRHILDQHIGSVELRED